MIGRREFLLGASAAAVGGRATAQETPTRAHVGFIVTGDAYPRSAFFEALQRLGWVEGRNLLVERRVTGNDPDRRRAAAAELVAGKPDLIVAAGVNDALPVRALTHTIPIVVISGADLIAAGLANSLVRPGGNVTGMTVLGQELDGKRLQLLRELLPGAKQISVLAYSQSPWNDTRVVSIEGLARPLGIHVAKRLIGEAAELDRAFAACAADHDQAILVQQGPVIFENGERVVALAGRYHLPAIYVQRDYVEKGGLISYGSLWKENFERAASLADKILKGAKPADLPIERPTKFELVVNLKTAKELGLTVPPSILVRADEVIE